MKKAVSAGPEAVVYKNKERNEKHLVKKASRAIFAVLKNERSVATLGL